MKNFNLKTKDCDAVSNPPSTLHFPPSNSGFSLIELMVTITIFIMITSVTMTNYPRFSNKLSLDLLAQDIALSLRQAQISGSSVLGVRGAAGQSRVFGAYGIHLESPDPVITNKYFYILFADISNLLRYDGPLTGQFLRDENPECGIPTMVNECLQKFLVAGANKVRYLCANFIDQSLDPQTDWVANCAKQPIAWLDVVFKRPNLDALFYAKKNPTDTSPMTGVSNVGIVLESPGGEYNKTIVVWKTGQISVQ